MAEKCGANGASSSTVNSPLVISHSSTSTVDSYMDLSDLWDTEAPSMAKGLTVRRIYRSRGSSELVMHLTGDEVYMEWRITDEGMVKVQTKLRASTVSTVRARSCSGQLEEVNTSSIKVDVGGTEGNSMMVPMDHGLDTDVLRSLGAGAYIDKVGNQDNIEENIPGDVLNEHIEGENVRVEQVAPGLEQLTGGVDQSEAEDIDCLADAMSTAATISDDDLASMPRAHGGMSVHAADLARLALDPSVMEFLRTLVASSVLVEDAGEGTQRKK